MNKKFFYVIAGIIWLAIIFYLLTLPGNDFPKAKWIENIHVDKLVHISLFFVLCYIFGFLVKDKKKALLLFFIISFLALLYGIAMEFVQKYFTTTRSFDVTDMIADGVGAYLAYFLWLYKIKKKAPVETGAATKTNCL